MADERVMTSSRPYLIRAVYEWLVDNGCTPQILVDAGVEGVAVPAGFVEDGRIMLNISARAVAGLSLGAEAIEFNARFGGSPFRVVVPPRAVLAMVAREGGAGMTFPEEESGLGPDPDPDPDTDPEAPPPRERPTLKVVK